MGEKGKIKNRIKLGFIILLFLLAVILIVFGIHAYQVRRYNAAQRTLHSGDINVDGITADFHPRGQTTDSWEKNDKNLPGPLNGVIYEFVISNASVSTLEDWTLRLNVSQFCYITNAWCGTVEIHQFINGTEKTQKVDLRNYDRESLTLDHLFSGSDLLIPLQAGDYIVYYPNKKDGEFPIAAMEKEAESVDIGFIFYSEEKEIQTPDYTLSYTLHQDVSVGTVATVCRIAFILWGLLVIAFIILSILVIQYERRLEVQDKMVRESLDVFSNFVDAKDPYTYGHSRRVARYAFEIAKELGFHNERCKQIYYIALLHDIGKCYVPDEILKKPAALTEEEFEIVKAHCAKGAEMVKGLSSIPEIQEGILSHHERYDGTGYPRGKKGDEIPLVGRIICVADSYDAMSSNRVYRKKFSKTEALEELRRNSGTQFDPKIVEAFIRALKKDEEENASQVF